MMTRPTPHLWRLGSIMALLAGGIGLMATALAIFIVHEQGQLSRITGNTTDVAIEELITTGHSLRNLERLRAYGDILVDTSDEIHRQRALLAVTMLASHPSLDADPRLAGLATRAAMTLRKVVARIAQTPDTASGRLLARRHAVDDWTPVSEELAATADRLSLEVRASARQGSVQLHDVIRQSNNWMTVALFALAVLLAAGAWLFQSAIIGPIRRIAAYLDTPPGGAPLVLPPILELRCLGNSLVRHAELERQLSRLTARMPGYVHTIRLWPDGHGSMPFASAGIRDLYGLRPEDVAHDTAPLADMLHPGDRARFMAAAAESIRTRAPFQAEFRVLSPVKGEIWLESRSEPEAAADGGMLWHGLTIDITERKRYEAEVLGRTAAESRLSRLTEVAPGALFTVRRSAGGKLSMPWASGKLVEVAGCWPEEVLTDISALSTLMHASDANAWRMDAAASAPTQLPWHSEFRLAHPIRGEVWLEWRATPEREAGGGTLWHGFLHDITERKAAEDGLRMAASVFDTAREGIIITDTAANILKINPAFTRITGYDLDEVQGKKPSVLSSGHNDKAFYAAMWASLRKTGAWTGEIVNRRKDGEVFTEFLSISGVHDRNGDLVHYVGIFSDISQIKQHEQRLEHMAQHDTLTGLPNRILLTDRMQQAIAQSRRSGEKLAVLFLDLDGFKPINDKHGHDAGDRTLIEMGQRMSKVLRASDTVARIGGDEFVILLPGLSSMAECEFSARRVLMAIAEPIEDGENRFLLSASIGIALYPDDADDADSLLRHADEAMYTAKRTGRNQLVFYCNDLREQTKLDGGTVHDLRLALERGEIEVHYQPIVNLATGRVAKAEALVRWRHPVRGMVPPAEFIPVAEGAGLIQAIGDLVFRQAVQVASIWNTGHSGGPPRRICVNRSPREFFGHDGVDGWIAHLNSQRVSGEMLSLEITEGLLLNDRPTVLTQLKQLRAMGMTIALDDFGTGYSSLSYLKKFDIDHIKIDHSFIRDIVDDPSDRAIVESIIAMAHRLGIELIAEGVETEAQAALLAVARCDFAQGYLYARPMPEQEFLAFVRTAETTPLPVPALLDHVD